MKTYKILHKPSGMYFKPSRYPTKLNLSKNGKVYFNKPNIKRFLGEYYHRPLTKEEKQEAASDWRISRYAQEPVVESEWEIVEFNMVEE